MEPHEPSSLHDGNGPQPSLFVPHGAPTFALQPGAAGAALTRLGGGLARPRAVVILSPHWSTATPVVGAAARPPTIHDFWGFPRELQTIGYPASGCAEASKEIAETLRAARFAVELDASRGLDHGAWIPLRFLFPEADVPVIPISIQAEQGPLHHLRLGRALAHLATRGFLIVASGNLTHNLGDYQRAVQLGLGTPEYVRAFADWIWDRIRAGELDALLDYRRLAPGGTRAHPQEDHLLPLFVALGVAPELERAERVHAGVDEYVLAMDAYQFPCREARA